MTRESPEASSRVVEERYDEYVMTIRKHLDVPGNRADNCTFEYSSKYRFDELVRGFVSLETGGKAGV